MGLPHRFNHWEVNLLKLGAEHVPFPCSLLELVLDRYAEPPAVGRNAHPMQLNELLEYLKNIDNFNLSPWVAVAAQTEAIGDPATPSREQVAILRWLGKALEIWEKQFPLEGRLAAQVRRLKPLSGALAIVDPTFMQPGAHPLHKLLDSIQAKAIGWQVRLDRAGAILEQQVTRAVDQSREWFENKSIDLAGIGNEFSMATERDQARAQRMIQRVVDAEAGKVKTAAAKQTAAHMINTLLDKFAAPEEIGEFIKGPWYTSAQLLLLKFGSDSEYWQTMSATTETLLDSLQSLEEADDTRRQYIFEVVTRLPKEMRRWLLSLHHDTEAVNEAMGLVERAHLRILRRQTLDLKRIEPIVVEGERIAGGEEKNPSALKAWHEGQWCTVDNDEGIVRVQLVLKVEQSQQLLFTNMAGLKVLQLSFAEFDRLLDQNRVKALNSGASFSLCLAYAVGIDSVEILNALVSALSQSEAIPTPTSQVKPEPHVRAESTRARRRQSSPRPPPEPGIASGPETAIGAVEPEEGLVPATGEQDSGPEISAGQEDIAPERPADKKTGAGSGFLIDQAEEIKARGGYRLSPDTSPEPDADDRNEPQQPGDTGLGYLTEQASGISAGRDSTMDSAEEPGDVKKQAEDDENEGKVPADQAPAPRRQIKLAMGAWLGFHDGETPLMARLAVHDPEEGYYIFVNRNGVKMRQVSSEELIRLVDSGLVDILETNSNFRNDVSEVRKNLDQ